MFPDELLDAIANCGRTGQHRLLIKMPLNVHRKTVGRFVTAVAVLLQGLHHDPVQIAAHERGEFGWDLLEAPRHFRRLCHAERLQPGRGTRGIGLAQNAPHLVQTRTQQHLRIERRLSCQQFIEQHAQAVDVSAGVEIEAAHLGLFRTHVGRRAEELLERGEQRFVRELLIAGGLGDAEVDHFGHRHAIVQGHQDVRGLDVAMDDALLVRVLDGVTDLHEQVEPLGGGEMFPVAVVVDADALHQFHHEVGPAILGGAGVQHTGDVRMVHQRQRLPLGLEPGDDLFGVHPQLDDLEGDLAPHRLVLLRHPHAAHAALADELQKFVGADAHAFTFSGRGLGFGRGILADGAGGENLAEQAFGALVFPGVGGQGRPALLADSQRVHTIRLASLLSDLNQEAKTEIAEYF